MDELIGIYKKEGYGADIHSAFLDARDGDPCLGNKTQVIRLNPGKTAETREQYVSRVLKKDIRFVAHNNVCAAVKGWSNGRWFFYCQMIDVK